MRRLHCNPVARGVPNGATVQAEPSGFGKAFTLAAPTRGKDNAMSTNAFVTFVVGLLSAGMLSDDVRSKPTLSVPPLAGTVVDEESGRPLEGVIVRLETSGSPRAWSRTDAAGRYAFQDWLSIQPRTASGAPAIEYGMIVTVRALHPHYGMSAKMIQPTCGGPPYELSAASCTQEVGFSLRAVGLSLGDSAPFCTMEGHIVVDGRPGNRSQVLLESGEVETVTDSEGKFRLERVTPGLRTMMVRRLAATTHERAIWVGCEREGDVIRVGFELNEWRLDE